jgi:NADPH oxidase
VAVAYGWYSQETNKKLSGLNMLKFSVWSSRGAGLVLAFDGAMILVPSEWPGIRRHVCPAQV